MTGFLQTPLLHVVMASHSRDGLRHETSSLHAQHTSTFIQCDSVVGLFTHGVFRLELARLTSLDRI